MESIWHESIRLPRFLRLEGEISTDVLVIGGGMAGLGQETAAGQLRTA